MGDDIHIDTFSRFFQVSRETITSLSKYEEVLIKANKNLNLVGKSTINDLWIRHFLDSAQLIDFIDKNDKTLVDLGSGAGFPGLVLGLLMRDRKIKTKIKLIEKSPKKAKFLQNLINKFNLNAEVINKDILLKQVKLSDDVYVARAFKPLETILKLIHNNAVNWKKIFVFLGKTGHDQILQASKIWDIEYKQRISVTNSDSLIIEINRLRKKN